MRIIECIMPQCDGGEDCPHNIGNIVLAYIEKGESDKAAEVARTTAHYALSAQNKVK